MNRYLLALLLSLGLIAAACAQDRLSFSVSNSTLTDTDGGDGAAIGWLHNFSPDAVLGVGGEYQSIAGAHWTFGSLRAALTRGPAERRRSLYGEFHKGSGSTVTNDFNYQTGTIGVALPLAGRLSMQLEDKQVDIDTTHGNMPKLGLTMAWTPQLQTNVSYAQSVGGNLATKLGALRLDYYGRAAHLLTGGAVGRANPVVFDLPGDVQLPGFTSRQAFAGVSRAFSRTELLLLGDYLEVAGIERLTVTLSCTLNLRSGAAGK